MMNNFECLLLTQKEAVKDILINHIAVTKDNKLKDCDFVNMCNDCNFNAIVGGNVQNCKIETTSWLEDESDYFNRLGVFAIPRGSVLEIAKSVVDEKGDTTVFHYVGYYVGFREDKEGKVHHYINKSTTPAHFLPAWSSDDIPFELNDIVSVLKIGCVSEEDADGNT